MMRSSLILLLLLPLPLLAQELKIAVNGKNELILSGVKCEVLLEQEKALCAWKKKDFTPRSSCDKDSKGSPSITVSTCLPDFTLAYHQKALAREGANCWGTAMSFKGLSHAPRFIWPEEMLYWMDSPVCRKLETNEALLPGDIINVYGPEKLDEKDAVQKDAGTKLWDLIDPKRSTKVAPDRIPGYSGFHRLIHSVTFVSPKLAFGKDSPSKLDRFYFHPMEEVYGRPRSDEKDCQENQSLTPYMREYQQNPKRIRGSKCSYFSLAFRCENLMDYFVNKGPSEEDKKILKSIESLKMLQKKLFPLTVSSANVVSAEEVKQIVILADATVERVSLLLKQSNKETLSQELLVLEYFSAAALRQTLEQAKLVKPLN